ncbi:hypothetical protein RM704_35995 [Streptomyces sp. DSM 3412]|uniref:Uncharacterized protein n=1 Tax=Streptomyces gottesmaniae TaxID=3075518 RepID=A0ABU2Z8Y2_9ACTN|nr:hypothetical protein [Streptomyces sp. DSM 3412]MDT0572805.1 hypothetical protein [Streptomyces sp. DSM 3412]
MLSTTAQLLEAVLLQGFLRLEQQSDTPTLDVPNPGRRKAWAHPMLPGNRCYRLKF